MRNFTLKNYICSSIVINLYDNSYAFQDDVSLRTFSDILCMQTVLRRCGVCCAKSCLIDRRISSRSQVVSTCRVSHRNASDNVA